jgi:hypothetical protein
MMTGTDQVPTFIGRRLPTAWELAEPTGVLDLPEGRSRDRFAPNAQSAVPQDRQGLRRAGLRSRAGGRLPARRPRPRLAMLLTSRGNARLETALLQSHDIGRRPVSDIRQHDLGPAVEPRHHRRDPGLQLLGIRPRGRHMLGDDHLVGRVHRELGVES